MRTVILTCVLGALPTLAFAAKASPDSPRTNYSCTAAIPGSEDAWSYEKEDPATKTLLVLIHAVSCEKTVNPSIFRLTGVTGRVYRPATSSYSNLKIDTAFFDEKSAALIYGTNLGIVPIP